MFVFEKLLILYMQLKILLYIHDFGMHELKDKEMNIMWSDERKICGKMGFRPSL